MKKKIFNIGWLFAIAAIASFGFTSCDEDRDSNPTLDLSHVAEGFVLNTPANAANNTYDLASAETVALTCSQPNYGGVPYATRYYVQVSDNPAFLNDTTVDHKELPTSYTTAKMAVDASELNNAVVELFQKANPDTDYPNNVKPIYIRLRAALDGTSGMGQTYSNIITLPKTLATYVAPAAELPTQLYVVGASIGTAWTTWQVAPQVYGVSGNYYTIVYVPAGGQLKWGTFENDWRGYNRLRTIKDEAQAEISESTDGNSNITFKNAGWYSLLFTGEIVGKSVQYDLTVYPGKVYVIGNACDNWGDADASLACTAPADQTGQWISPAFKQAGELRAYIKVGTYKWWRTEFTLYKGTTVYYRDFDIPSSWAQGAREKAVPAKPDPDNYSIQCSAGQRLYVSFDTGTGEVK